jgi:DNA-directed RNA polymerase subunit RPC12/RpoP
MTEDPKPRRTLSLKPGVVVTRVLGPEPLRPIKPAKLAKPAKPAAPPPEPVYGWKCKPCGQGFDPPVDAMDDEAVRCPKCNAKLGKAGDFKLDPIPTRLRARPI